MTADKSPATQATGIRVVVQYATRVSGLPPESDFQAWADAIPAPGGPIEVTVRLVGEAEGHRLNLDHRGQDQATNVLSFPAQLPDEVASGFSERSGYRMGGDLVICAPVVKREAALQDKPVLAHWAHLTVHGILHLLGYDHVNDEDARVMEQMEIRILAGLGIPDPYAPVE